MHKVFNELQLSQTGIVHSISKQVTCIKKMDAMTGVNANAIANLSSIVKGVVSHSHEKFKEVRRYILCLNVSIHNQSELHMVIRQLEFGLLKLTQRLSELMDAIECIFLEKLPVNLLNPITLRNILKNVSLHLPGGYEWVIGT